MEKSCIHHVEFGVRNGEEYVRKFRQQYKFALIGTRFTKHLKQWVLLSGTARILLTQQLLPFINSTSDIYHVPWIQSSSLNEKHSLPHLDSVYNVALKVKNIKEITEKLSRSGVSIVKPLQTVADADGEVKLATVKSCIGNVVHTLIDDAGYKGLFLPKFNLPDMKELQLNSSETLTTHFDHVTFACNCGDSEQVLNWYSNNFGMRRFLMNR